MRTTTFSVSHPLIILFLFLAIALGYSNTFTAGWHFDDTPNILNNSKIHIQSLDAESLSQAFWANPKDAERLTRPIAYASFALNWYLGADQVLGYHVVNIFLHWANALLLYMIILHLLPFALPAQRGKKQQMLIAAFATLLWALNPMQTQAVTYIVQRMAVLATFFFLASLLFYLIARKSSKKTVQSAGFLLSLVCFILAMGSKENAITLPVSILLIEWIFFRSLGAIGKKHVIGALVFAGLSILAILLVTKGDPWSSITGYGERGFTLEERLLTESRIVVFYLSLLFFPAPWRLSLDHDILLSTSLIQPPATLAAIVFLLALLAWGVWRHKKYPFTSFAILFFLLNHLTESTIFPLELIFEHRNYLPSLFLFLPVAGFCARIYDSLAAPSQGTARKIVIALPCLLIAVLVAATFTRNRVWQTEQSLWEDSLAKAPGQARPYINLSHVYRQLDRWDEAFELSRTSLEKVSPTPLKDRMRGYAGMAEVLMQRGETKEALEYYRQALASYEEESLRYRLHMILLKDGQFDAAREELETLIAKHPEDSHLSLRMGILLVQENKLLQAKVLMEEAVRLAKKNSYEFYVAQLSLGSVLSRQGDFVAAEQKFASVFSTFDPRLSLFCIIGNDLNQKDAQAAQIHATELLKHFSLPELLELLQSRRGEDMLFPLDAKDLIDYLRFIGEGEQSTDDASPVLE